jgi:hypothetical protein
MLTANLQGDFSSHCSLSNKPFTMSPWVHTFQWIEGCWWLAHLCMWGSVVHTVKPLSRILVCTIFLQVLFTSSGHNKSLV